MSLSQLYAGRKVLVCAGTGGVGKTTVAASLALAAARAGRNVLVMTIDPSRRLAHSLGIDKNNSEIAQIHPAGPAMAGTLSALVLDVQATFDSLIRARASSKAQADSILQNRIYQHFSASLAGSHEYAAVEKLWDAVHDPRFDLVVLDTPPAQNALDFLEAPGRILRFLEGQQLVERVPGAGVAKKLSQKLFNLGGGFVKKNVARIAGGETLDDVLAFLRALTDMYDSFRERARGVEALLQSADVSFVLVGGPSAAQADAIAAFEDALQRFDIRAKAFVLNRVRPQPLAADDAAQAVPWQEALLHSKELQALSPEQRQEMLAALADELDQADGDAAALRALRKRAAERPVLVLHERIGDVDNLAALGALAELLQEQDSA